METETVTAETAQDLRRELDQFLAQFDDCIKTGPSRAHLRTYIGGQHSQLPRKSIEPMALDAGVAPRSLQEFMGLHRWAHDAVRSRVHEVVAHDHAAEHAVGVIDETSAVKKGDQTAGVQRQYCGASGKTDNCVVTVHLGYAAGDFATLLDGDLYLPRETWCADTARREAAGIPPDVQYRPKWQIALDLLDRAQGHGVRLKYLTADELYGRAGEFRAGAAARGLQYVVEIPCNLRGWTKPPRWMTDRHGRPRRAPGQVGARRVDALWRRGGPSWTAFHVKDTEKGPVVWEARSTRFQLVTDPPGAPAQWLLAAHNVLTDERKYFLSNAPPDAPLEVLLRVAFSRAVIERLFEDAKDEIGFDHFEVRRYLPLQRHLVLSSVSLLFLMERAQVLREKKPVVERRASAGFGRSATGRRGAAESACPASGARAAQNSVLASPPPPSRTVPSQTNLAKIASTRHLHLAVAQV
jgi:SRSO17 transposase